MSDRNWQREWYQRNKERINAEARRRRAKNRKLIQKAKSKPCADCGVEYPPHVMDFDHVRGKKRCHIAGMQHYLNVQYILDEIAKCDVVCANCHRVRTHKQRKRGIFPAPYSKCCRSSIS